MFTDETMCIFRKLLEVVSIDIAFNYKSIEFTVCEQLELSVTILYDVFKSY